ncbi:MAG: sugar phosphate nucleotidyltransferase [Micrococcales bacterium]|nr:sugar phosphate nucleotidyltransferase [Micrococcales bacterium]
MADDRCAPESEPTATPIAGFFAVVPAGGAGTRLWPLSRAGRPKFLLDLTGSGRTLLQGTVDRLLPLTGPDGVLVVTGVRHADAVRAQLPEVAADDVLAEPAPRDSMAAIGLAAALLERRHGPRTVLGSFAADHVIAGIAEFARAVREGVAAARAGYVATIGIEPTEPTTALGYIHAGAPLGVADAPSARHVVAFTEKPDADTAATYVASGEYRWNAGMFLSQVGVLLDHLAAELPPLAAGLRAIAAAWDTPGRDAVLAATWPGLTKIAIDHAIAEPVAARGGVAVVPASFGWDDVGDFASLAGLLAPSGALTLGDDEAVLRLAADGALVATSGRTVTVIGVPDAVVIDTADAVLVTTRAHAQAVKSAVDAWRAAGREQLL